MKKKLLSLLTMVFCALSFIVQAQNPPCSLKAKFDFKADNCKISFSDFSAAATGTTITSWFWDFGDATTSNLQNPTHLYTVSGTYTVCLTIIGNNGLVKCKDQFCLSVTVKGCEQVMPCGVKPLFSFKVDKCTVYFTDLSGTNPGTSITNWYWSFGDATTSTLQNPIHTYTTPGTYSVCLITVAINTAGQQCKNEYCFPVKVEGCGDTPFCKLAAKFDFKVDKCKVGFTDLSAVGVGTTITNWYWDFGDATTSTLQHPTHVYSTAGTYNVCLVIVGINAAGKQCKDKICNTITVKGCGDVPCKLAAKFQFKTDKCTVGFSDLSAVGVGTTITNWHWDFGDATTSTLQNPTHVYATAGTYTVCLTIIGNNGLVRCKDQFCQKVTVEGCGQVEPCKLAAKFDFKVDKCKVGFIDLSATGVGTTITNWYWSFGDATSSVLQNPTHIYTAAGTYSVCLTIVGTNANGQQCKDQFCQKVTVEGCGQTEPCKLYPKFNFKQDSCTIYFTDLSAAGLGTTITNWYWDFGDATTSTLQNPTHVYSATGTYTVCLTIVGINAGVQCKEQFCMKIDAKGCGDVRPCQVYAKFDYKIDSCNVYFVDYSAAGAGTTLTSWFWDFGDGNTSTLQNPIHSYLTPGTYTVCLYVTGVNAAGVKCENKVCLQVIVKDCSGQPNDCKLYAKFDFKIDSCTVYFADFSGTGAGTTITNWYWDFGDATTSTAQHPSHVYAASGTYTVCLIIVGTNAAGQQCKDKICNTLTVQGCGDVRPCQVYAKFDYKIDGCGVYFMDYSGTGAGTTIANWFWDFGDGNTSTLQNPSHVYTTPGTYTVCLNVVGVNASGVKCEDKLCLTITVKDCGQTTDCKLYPKFGFKIDSCKVSFVDFSGAAPGTTITGWFWNFGDGNTSVLQNPTYSYTAPGTYTVCLLITGVNAAGVKCENKICLVVEVRDCYKHGITADKADASLLAVYPNPASDNVNISFKMKVAGQVNITVTDVQGRIIAVVKDGYYNYGYHNINWNADVRAGWYLITIKTAEGVDQKQLLISK